MDSHPNLPGFELRPLSMSDLEAATAIVNASEVAVEGRAETTSAEIEAAWSRPGFDLDTMSIGVESQGGLVAAAEVFRERAEVSVHPDYTGRGIGTELAKWTWTVARDHGNHQVGQTVNDSHVAARELLANLGYTVRWTSWVLQIDLSDLDPEPPLSEGMTLRAAAVDDLPVLYRIVEDSFNEWPDRTPATYEDWKAVSIDHPSARLDQSVVACWNDEPVGVGIAFDYEDGLGERWVEQLAVAAPLRGKGIGKSILARMFHDFADAGYATAGLSTDSRTGALTLYEHLGMTVTRSYTRWNRKV